MYGSTTSEMQSVADLVVGGKLDLSDSISERFPLEEVNKWLEHLYKKIGSPIHIVVEVK
jgi:Zn-dependent alcohol dehydrogenase